MTVRPSGDGHLVLSRLRSKPTSRRRCPPHDVRPLPSLLLGDSSGGLRYPAPPPPPPPPPPENPPPPLKPELEDGDEASVRATVVFIADAR